ncbi:MAG: hypothetical protein K1W12_03890 [Turicimonas muris]
MSINQNCVKFAFGAVANHMLKSWTLVCSTRDCTVCIFTNYFQIVIGSKAVTNSKLRFNTFFSLVAARVSGIDYSSFNFVHLNILSVGNWIYIEFRR